MQSACNPLHLSPLHFIVKDEYVHWGILSTMLRLSFSGSRCEKLEGGRADYKRYI